MACGAIQIRSLLTGNDMNGGTWVVTSGIYTGSLVGDNPSVTISDIPAGTFTEFTYTGPGCGPNTSSTIRLYNMDLGSFVAQDGDNYDFCPDSPAVNLATLMGAVVGPDGSLFFNPFTTTPGLSGSGVNTIFNPAGLAPGVISLNARIFLRIPSGFTNLGCCDAISITVTLTVLDVFTSLPVGGFINCS